MEVNKQESNRFPKIILDQNSELGGEQFDRDPLTPSRNKAEFKYRS